MTVDMLENFLRWQPVGNKDILHSCLLPSSSDCRILLITCVYLQKTIFLYIKIEN